METLYNDVLRTENTVFHFISGKWYKAQQIGFEKIIYEVFRFISSCLLEFPLYSQLFACFMELQIGTTNCASVHSFVPWFILLNFVFFLSREFNFLFCGLGSFISLLTLTWPVISCLPGHKHNQKQVLILIYSAPTHSHTHTQTQVHVNRQAA